MRCVPASYIQPALNQARGPCAVCCRCVLHAGVVWHCQQACLSAFSAVQATRCSQATSTPWAASGGCRPRHLAALAATRQIAGSTQSWQGPVRAWGAVQSLFCPLSLVSLSRACWRPDARCCGARWTPRQSRYWEARCGALWYVQARHRGLAAAQQVGHAGQAQQQVASKATLTGVSSCRALACTCQRPACGGDHSQERSKLDRHLSCPGSGPDARGRSHPGPCPTGCARLVD